MRLGFYINQVALLRGHDNYRVIEPAVIASLAETAGAQVIIAGWSKSGGSLGERDFRLLRELVTGDLTLIVPLGSEHVETVVRLRPNGVILVAAGWDGVSPIKTVAAEIEGSELAATAAAYHSAGVTTAVFVDPDAALAKSSARCGLKGVVLDCSHYSEARTDTDAQLALDKLADAALAANKFGLFSAAFGGITYSNVGPVVDTRFIEEVHIGISILSRALLIGIDRAVSEMLAVISSRN